MTALTFVQHRRLQAHIARLPEDKRPAIEKSFTSLSQTPFNSLKLRLNQPYWMLHWGNCEHFIVVDQIRYFAFSAHKYT